MGILQRFKNIMSANINSVLLKSEDVDTGELLKNYLRELNETLRQIKSEMSTVEAEESINYRKLSENEQSHAKYYKYAADAVKAGNDFEAKKFLDYCKELETKKSDIQIKYDMAKQNTLKMAEMINKIAGDIDEIQKKLEELEGKLTFVKQQEKLNKLNETLQKNSLDGVDGLIDKVQNEIYFAEAIATLNEEENLKRKNR